MADESFCTGRLWQYKRRLRELDSTRQQDWNAEEASTHAALAARASSTLSMMQDVAGVLEAFPPTAYPVLEAMEARAF